VLSDCSLRLERRSSADKQARIRAVPYYGTSALRVAAAFGMYQTPTDTFREPEPLAILDVRSLGFDTVESLASVCRRYVSFLARFGIARPADCGESRMRGGSMTVRVSVI
jgi:hypothetical protein